MVGYIKIQNDGVIDENAFLLLGASTKRNDESKIGFFGSGLKYAIAVLLRNKIPFYVYADKKQIKFETIKEKFRDNEFNVIYINGQKTGLTTDMGPSWYPWFALREIYCNALDEADGKLTIADAPKGEAGKTTFYIAFDEKISDVFSNWNRYFSEKRQDILVDDTTIGFKAFIGSENELLIYRKGVQAYQTPQKCLFHYDLKRVRINESRVIENTGELYSLLAQYLARSATPEMIALIFDKYHNTYESRFLWTFGACQFNQNWLDVIDKRPIVVEEVAGYFIEEMGRRKCLVLPKELATALKEYFKNKVKVLGMSDKSDNGFELQFSAEQKEYLQFSLDWLKKAGINITIPVKFWQFNDTHIMGEAKQDHIRVSPRAFEFGKKMLVATLYEEWAHLESGAEDKTRAFQDFLLLKVIDSLEAKVGDKL